MWLPHDALFAQDLAAIPPLAETNKLDSIVLGSVNRDEAGAFVFEVRLYDRQMGGFKITKRGRVESILDVFDAADFAGFFAPDRLFGSITRLNN